MDEQDRTDAMKHDTQPKLKQRALPRDRFGRACQINWPDGSIEPAVYVGDGIPNRGVSHGHLQRDVVAYDSDDSDVYVPTDWIRWAE
jgi:hypothetical protein